MHFCSVLHFAKANHNRATLCLSFAHLLYSAQFFAITTSFYSVPLLYLTVLFYSILGLYVSLPCPTSPMRYISLQHIALLRFSSTSLCGTSLYFAYAKLFCTFPTRNLSLLYLCKLFCVAQYHSDTLLCYASPKQIITQQLCTFALPIITTISHAVAYFVLLFHMNVPFLVERFLLIAFEIVQSEIPKYLAASFTDGNVFPDSKCFTDFLWLYP